MLQRPIELREFTGHYFGEQQDVLLARVIRRGQRVTKGILHERFGLEVSDSADELISA